MAEKIRVDTAKLNSDANKVGGAIKKMRKKMSGLESQAKELDAMWDGEASDAFKLEFWKDIKKLNKILKKLDSIYNYETNAKSEYDKCEKKVEAIVASISTK